MARKIPEINAAPQADIAFLLLIFYLVSTTMNVDSGIYRMLPPWVEKAKTDANKVKERNLMKVSVSSQDLLMIGDQWADLTQLKDKVKEFVTNPENLETLPEKEVTEIDLIGEYPISKGVVSLQNTRETSYDMYVKVQNELSRAVNELRDGLSMEKFSRKFSDLTPEQQKAITKAIPNQISEAEPRDMTGKK